MKKREAGSIINRRVDALKRFRKYRTLHFILIPVAVWCLVFYWLPLAWNVLAFQEYSIRKGPLRSEWVGLKHFIRFFTNPLFAQLMRNTISISLLKLIFGTLAAVAFAILLNELRSIRFKRTIQTLSYLPYFVSWAVCANLFLMLLGVGGPVSRLLHLTGLAPESYTLLVQKVLFWPIITLQDIWKGVGWGAIIYLAAIAGIPSSLYEAATIDGAGRFGRIWHITLPCLLPTISILLILSSGSIIRVGFEQMYLMYNPAVMELAEVIDTYVYKIGLGGGQYSYATAIGMFQSVVAVLMVASVNRLSKTVSDYSLF